MSNASAIVAPPLGGFVSYHEGIIGAALFDSFVVEIDYDRMQLRLHDPETYRAPKKSVSVPLTLSHNMPFVDLMQRGRQYLALRG